MAAVSQASDSDLILVNPRLGGPWVSLVLFLTGMTHEPSALLVLAALTPARYRVRVINMKLIWWPWDFPRGALVGITCVTEGVSRAYRLADRFRKAGSTVILGGPHVSVLPEEALQHADSVVIGEAESEWAHVIADFETGNLRKIYRGVPLKDFFTPVYDYFRRLDIRRLMRVGVPIDRGCKYTCEFCCRISDDLRFVKQEQVIALITRIKDGFYSVWGGRPRIFLRADNIFSSPAYAKELFTAMIPLNINWGGAASVDIGFDEDALELARRSGCRGLLIGFETANPGDFQKTSLKNIRSVEDYRVAIRNIQSRGIRIIGSFIFGLDSYHHADYARLLWFILRSGLWHAQVGLLTPFPGTLLAARLKEQGRILSYDWQRYTLSDCVIKPLHMSRAALYAWFIFIRVSAMLVSRIVWKMWISVLGGWILVELMRGLF